MLQRDFLGGSALRGNFFVASSGDQTAEENQRKIGGIGKSCENASLPDEGHLEQNQTSA